MITNTLPESAMRFTYLLLFAGTAKVEGGGVGGLWMRLFGVRLVLGLCLAPHCFHATKLKGFLHR